VVTKINDRKLVTKFFQQCFKKFRDQLNFFSVLQWIATLDQMIKFFQIDANFFPSKLLIMAIESGWSNFFYHWLWLSKLTIEIFLSPILWQSNSFSILNHVATKSIFSCQTYGDRICFWSPCIMGVGQV
jgi:hypothetical protein